MYSKFQATHFVVRGDDGFESFYMDDNPINFHEIYNSMKISYYDQMFLPLHYYNNKDFDHDKIKELMQHIDETTDDIHDYIVVFKSLKIEKKYINNTKCIINYPPIILYFINECLNQDIIKHSVEHDTYYCIPCLLILQVD